MEKNIDIETFSILNKFLKITEKVDSLIVLNKDSFFVFQFIKDNKIEIVHFEIDQSNQRIILKIDHLNTFENKKVILRHLKVIEELNSNVCFKQLKILQKNHYSNYQGK